MESSDFNNTNRRKGGWISPEGEFIPLLPGKEHLATIDNWARKNGIKYDKLQNIYFTFLDLGFVMFDEFNITAGEALSLLKKKIIEEELEREVRDGEVIIFSKKWK